MGTAMTPRVRKMLLRDTQRHLSHTTTMNVPRQIQREIGRRHKGLELRYCPEDNKFKLFEHFPIGATPGIRHIWDYENPDGSAEPIVLKIVLDFIREADTRRWPMEERMKFFMQKREEQIEENARQHKQDRIDRILEDYDYIAGIKTFFMDPKSMPEWVSKHTPYQERALKRLEMKGESE